MWKKYTHRQIVETIVDDLYNLDRKEYYEKSVDVDTQELERIMYQKYGIKPEELDGIRIDIFKDIDVYDVIFTKSEHKPSVADIWNE